MVCTFAGHRPHRLPWGSREDDPRCVELKQQLAQAVQRAYDGGCDRFLCGMALGCDWYFCEAALALRAQHPEVRVEAAIPCPSQPDGWPEHCRARYYSLLAACDSRTVVEPQYSEGCMLRRNRWMVDRAQWLISVYDGHGGGTGAAVAYAKAKGLMLLPLWA